MKMLSDEQVIEALKKGRAQARKNKTKSPFEGEPKLPDLFIKEQLAGMLARMKPAGSDGCM